LAGVANIKVISIDLDGDHSMELEPIGFIKSPISEGIDEGWGEVHSEIHLNEEFSEGLEGIEQFSHVVILFYMHQSTFRPEDHLLRRPQGREDMPEIGIFAQRAKHRPNPLGITAVKLISRNENKLNVKGLDAIDGTPVLDIKPYFPEFDRIEQPYVPEWVDLVMANYF
jgi:tRNA-Thr(GGU) m(6)t(6)A37 methyltransferase TsaA